MEKREYRIKGRFACPLCQSKDIQSLMTDLFDDRFGQPDKYSIGYCSSCHIAFLQEILSVKDSKKLYNSYYPYEDITKKKLSWKNKIGILQNALRLVTGNIELAYHALPGQKVLDVGCGNGMALQILRLNGAIGTGLEIDERCIRHLKSEGLRFFKGTLGEYAKQSEERYDLIIMNQLLEHEYNPLSVLQAAKDLLSDNGKIMVSCPNYNSIWRRHYKRNWIHWHVPFHVSYFSRKSFVIMSAKLGLEIEKILIKTPLDWAAMNFYMQRRKPTRGKRNEQWQFSYPFVKKILFIPINIFANIIRKGDAIIVTVKRKEILTRNN